ncbi:hypothetical protein CEQ90_16170 [Lewinellaceae bacterium SD302]|nr:hypothetical protein CEQ90_16170 [Lewinellaceae bacterium SD302]
MTTVENCATGTLETFVPSAENPWDKAKVQHFYRRFGFGASPEQLETAFDFTPEQLVNYAFEQAFDAPLVDPPEYAYWTYQDFVDNGFEEIFPFYPEWMQNLMQRAIDNGPRERLTLFWHDHFATQYETYGCPSLLYQYFNILETHAVGDFKQLVTDVGITPAMLFFLNGFENTQFSPNENYARELFELFTLGADNNYTQQDIVEASRALTGYNGWTEYCGPVEFLEWGFDAGEKTIFGQTGNWTYEDLIDILFEQRSTEISEFICGKLYRYYVNPEVNEEIVSQLAQVFRDNNFTIEPVLRVLLASEHFFDEANMGVRIKSPMDIMLTFQRETGYGDFENRLEWMFWASAQLGEQLAEPPNVAGWTGDRSWIDSSRLTGRWEIMDGLTYTWAQAEQQLLVDLAKDLTDNSNSPEVITQAIVDHFVTTGLFGANAYETATDVLKWDIPQNYYDTGAWNLDWDQAPIQLFLLMQHIFRTPEFQLS